MSDEMVKTFAQKPEPLVIYNTLTRQKEIFTPLKNNHVKMYTCGPTVYHFAHIGNFRTFVFEDILRRTLKFFGYQVTQVMNITDVDDKTIKGAIEKKLPLVEFTKPYENAFFVDLQTLGVERVENYPAATDYIPQMIDFIQKLLDKGVAYKSRDKSIYFAIDKFANYGALSHLQLDELKVGAGDRSVACDEYDKESASDFVLWKAYDEGRDGHIFWESPFGKGRPGWHLECSTMAISLLGDQLDIHVGAVDNVFPHHENEIAQSECYTGKKFAKYWMHAEHLLVNHKKMSKSLGNFYTLRDLLEKGYSGPEVRYMLMHAHYRTQLNFTDEGMLGARNALQRLNDFAARMQEKAALQGDPTPECHSTLQKGLEAFTKGLADDLNMSSVLAAVFDLMHGVNVCDEQKKLTARDAYEVVYILQEFNRVLGIFNFQTESIDEEILSLLEKRNEARKSKRYAEADTFRKQIELAGYIIDDTPHGARLKRKI